MLTVSQGGWKNYLKLFVPPILLVLYRNSRSRLRPKGSTTPKPANVPGVMSDIINRLPACELLQLFPGIAEMDVNLPVSQIRRESGMLPFAELLTLAAISKHKHPRKIFEIGTYKGASTLIMAMHSPADTEIFTLDLSPGTKNTKYSVDIGNISGMSFSVGELYRDTEFQARIRQLYGDSADFDFEPFYNQMDLVFVDGNHAYENVKKDSVTAFKLICPGGVIIWDDYDISYGPGVMQALHEVTGKILYLIAGTRLAVYIDRAEVT